MCLFVCVFLLAGWEGRPLSRNNKGEVAAFKKRSTRVDSPYKMETCPAVEREVEKVLTKFSGLQEHSVNTIDDFITSIENIRKELAEGSLSTVIDRKLHID